MSSAQGERRATSAPLVPGLPVIGSAVDLLRDPYRFWAAQYRRFGPVFRIRVPLEGGVWIAMAGRDANAFLAREGHRVFSQTMMYPKAREILKTPLHPSITEGELQVHLKRQVAPGFSRHAAAPHLPAMASFVRDYVRGWLPGQRIDVVSEMARIGINCVSILASGREIGHDTDRFARYATVFTGVIAMSWPSALMALPPIRDAREGLDSMIEERLAEHRAHPPRGDREPDYFDLLLSGTMPDGSPLPDRVRTVFGQIPFKNMGVYAGRVINQVVYQLVHRPEVLAAVQPEIDDVFAGEPTPASLASMAALRATIKETLRTLPIAVAVQRTVCAPFSFEGYRFEVGDRLFMPISVPHFLEEYFPEPDRFDIERFLAGRREDLQAHVYTPFGLGNHACVATGAFEMMTSLILGSILHTWQMEAPYALRTIVDALPGPWPWHAMRVSARRRPLPTAPRPFAPEIDEMGAAEPLFAAVDRAEIRRLKEGEVLFEQGSAPDRVYLVHRGEVRVVRRDEGAMEPRELAVLGPGAVVGEIGILHGVPRTATVIARGAATVLAIDAAAFREAVTACDATGRELAAVAARRHATLLLTTILGSGERPDLGGAGAIAVAEHAPGEIVVRQGAPADHFYILADGSVEVTVERPSGRSIHVASLRAPDCFGEVGVLDGRPRNATVRTGDRGARVIALSREAFERLLDEPAIGADLAALAAERASPPMSRAFN